MTYKVVIYKKHLCFNVVTTKYYKYTIVSYYLTVGVKFKKLVTHSF